MQFLGSLEAVSPPTKRNEHVGGLTSGAPRWSTPADFETRTRELRGSEIRSRDLNKRSRATPDHH
eukprot:11778059-Alexandrium_andersonii.AAC.1